MLKDDALIAPASTPALALGRPPAHQASAIDGRLIDEASLVAGLRAGQEWAFETLVRVFGGRLLAVARRYTKSEQDAHDVLQSSYLSAFQALKEFRGASRLSTWLHRIVVNTALMRLRSERRAPEESIEPLLPQFISDGHHVEQFSTWSVPADQLVERREARAAVRSCIRQLPNTYRVILMLRDIEELSTAEVAEMLAITPTAVKVRLHRARQALTTLLRRDHPQL